MSIKTTLAKCIKLVEEDLNRYTSIQQTDSKAFGISEARAVQQYLTALSSAYRVAGGLDLDENSIEATTEELEQELLERLKEGPATSFELIFDLIIMNPSAAISTLRRRGYQIETKRERYEYEDGATTSIARYVLHGRRRVRK